MLPMKEHIKDLMEQPEELERLYRTDTESFTADFEVAYPEIQHTDLARYWKARLDFDRPKENTGKNFFSDIIALVVTCLLAGLLIKLREIFNLQATEFFFYSRNFGIIIMLALSVYAIWVNKLFRPVLLLFASLAFIIPTVYINLLPSDPHSDSINLACLHLLFLMWCVYGIIYTRFHLADINKRTEYIRYNGDMGIMGALILMAGGLLAGITLALFDIIGWNITTLYMEYIVVWGLVSAPVLATYIVQNNPSITHKIAPIIAQIFSPLVLITLVVYVVSIPLSGNSLYHDRDVLLVFNLMLFGVMGLLFFSISETSVILKQKWTERVLLALTVVALIIDIVALSAIFYRLGEWGITPNRIAVLGSNILIFGNLIWLMLDLIKVTFRKSEQSSVAYSTSKYLPVYALWALLVTFGFPLLFGMK